MKFGSFAGAGAGTDYPEEARAFRSSENCPIDQCKDDVCTHIVLQWDGNGYDEDRTWMTCDNEYVADLEDVR
jgi:hypothetical protein